VGYEKAARFPSPGAGGVMRVNALGAPPTRVQVLPVPARFDRSPEHGYADHAARAEPLRVSDGVPQHVGLLDQVARRYGSTVEVNKDDRQQYFASSQDCQLLHGASLAPWSSPRSCGAAADATPALG